MNKKRNIRKQLRGFTLVELMAVIGIIVVITSVILFNTSRFNSSILLRSLAYEVGLSLREAQLYGIAVRDAGGGTFNATYGVYFDSSVVGSSHANASYPLYADTYPTGNPDGTYEACQSQGATNCDPKMDSFQLRNGFYIDDVYVTPTSGAVESLKNGDITWVSINFKRPNPNAIIKTSKSAEIYSEADIRVASPGGSMRTVSVTATGQIVIH